MHTRLGGYHMRDVEFTLGIDVNVSKVGKDLSKAIFAEPNNMSKFADVPQLDVPVVRGMTHDGLGKYPSGMVKKAPDSTADIVKLLKDTKTDGVIIDAIRCAKIALDRKLRDRSLVHPLISSRRHPGNSGMISAAKKWKRLSREKVMSDVYCLIHRTQYETSNLKSL